MSKFDNAKMASLKIQLDQASRQVANQKSKIDALQSEVALLTKERDHLKEDLRFKSMRNGENVIARDKAKSQAGVWLNATADARLENARLRETLELALAFVSDPARRNSPSKASILVAIIIHALQQSPVPSKPGEES